MMEIFMPVPWGRHEGRSSYFARTLKEKSLHKALSVVKTPNQRGTMSYFQRIFFFTDSLGRVCDFLRGCPPHFFEGHGCRSLLLRNSSTLIPVIMRKQKSRFFSLRGLSCCFLLKQKITTDALKENFCSQSQ